MKNVARTIRFLNSRTCSMRGIRPSDAPLGGINYALVSGFFSSSLLSSLTSLLKIRSERPNERAESGNLFAPKSMTTTRSRISMCEGSRRNIRRGSKSFGVVHSVWVRTLPEICLKGYLYRNGLYIRFY